jgi:C4-dicarboxylate-specific signal transduction histidine kinase
MTAQPTELQPFAASLSSPVIAVRSVALRYGAAIAITAAITLLRFALDHFINDKAIYSFYFASVILAAWYLGLGPSLLNVVSGAVVASYYFAAPRNSIEVESKHIFGLMVFATVSTYLAFLIHWLRRDIARRQKAEADLLAAQELVQAHQAELAHAGRLSLMGEMSASLAHELNQPLHAARNYAQGSIRRLRKAPAFDPEVLLALERISEASDRAAEILRRVRDFVSKSAPHVAPLAVGDVLQDAAIIASMEPAPSRAKLEFDIAADLPPVPGDKVEIEQVVVNLARNGMESMSDLPAEERVLRLGARRRDGKSIELYVCDRGAGISADVAAKIFEPFYSTKVDGMGMGLAISRSIVERHDGRLWFTPNDDRGCTFHFTLPLKET